MEALEKQMQVMVQAHEQEVGYMKLLISTPYNRPSDLVHQSVVSGSVT